MVVPFINWQVGSVPAETVMAVGVPTVGVTVIVMAFEVAVEGDAQDELEVITQLITSPLA